MKSVEIESGPAKMITSGSIISFGENPVKIILEELQFLFAFKDEINDEGKKKDFKVEIENVDDKTLKFIFTNYNNLFGIGNIEPRPIGKYHGESLYLNYIISSDPTRKNKLIQYTFYTFKNTQGGEKAK